MRSYIKFYSWSMLWIIPLSLVFSIGLFDMFSIIMFIIASLGIPLGLKAVPRLAGQFDFHLGKGHYTYAWLWWNLFFFLKVLPPDQSSNRLVGFVSILFLPVLTLIIYGFVGGIQIIINSLPNSLFYIFGMLVSNTILYSIAHSINLSNYKKRSISQTEID